MENRQRKKSALDRFIVWLLAALQRSFIGRFFTSYEKANNRFERGIKESRHVSEKRFAGFIEKNRVINFIPKISQFLMRVPLRDYGIMMFMSGAVVAALYPINDMILFINVTFEMFVLGAAVCICAIPLFFSSRSLAANVLSSRLFCFILFDFFGMDREGFRQAAEKPKVSFATFSFLIGAALGIGSYFVLPTNTLLILLALTLAYCTVRTPEVGAVVTVLLIPFVNIYVTCICIAYTFICYMVKVSLGKRIFKFEYFDLWISITIFLLMLSGINYKDPMASMENITTNLIIMLSYFLFANLIYSKEWFRRSMVAFTTSSIVVAIIAICQAILRKMAGSFEVLEAIFSAEGEIVSTLGSSSVLAHFMVIAIPFALVHMISERNDATKFGGFLAAAVLVTALILADSPAGLVGFLLGSLLLFAFFKRRAIYLLVVVIVAIPVLYFTLPDSAIERVFSVGPLAGVSVAEELQYIKDTFLRAIEYPFGVNIVGETIEGVFGEKYIDSLPLQILANYGIVGVLAFVAMVIMFARVIMSYSVKAKNEYRRVNGCAGLCSILAILSVGVFNYVWVDKRVFLVFIMTMALSFAYIKIDREDELAPVRYVDITAATVDIPLKETVVHVSPPRRRYVHAPRMKRQLKRQEKTKTAEAKEFSNTDELFIIKRKQLEDAEQEE